MTPWYLIVLWHDIWHLVVYWNISDANIVVNLSTFRWGSGVVPRYLLHLTKIRPKCLDSWYHIYIPVRLNQNSSAATDRSTLWGYFDRVRILLSCGSTLIIDYYFYYFSWLHAVLWLCAIIWLCASTLVVWQYIGRVTVRWSCASTFDDSWPKASILFSVTELTFC